MDEKGALLRGGQHLRVKHNREHWTQSSMEGDGSCGTLKNVRALHNLD
jgi:hypothetical protein